jgi:thiol-disulfide isomerase/thioredoxin
MDAVFSWLFDHSTLLFGGIIAGALLTIVLLGRPRRWWKWTLDAVAVIAIVFAALMLYFFASVTSALDGRLATLTFTTPGDARVHRLSDYRGKVVMLNYWATWCPPCRAEIPDLNRVTAQWHGREVVFLALTDEDAAVIEKFTAKYPIRATVARFSSAPPKGAIETMAYGGRPTTLILDREGRVQRRLIGAQSFEEFDKAIRSVM